MFHFIPINRSKVFWKGHFRFHQKFKTRILKTSWKMAKKARIHFRINCDFFPTQWFVIEFKYKLILHHYSALNRTERDDFPRNNILYAVFATLAHYCVSVLAALLLVLLVRRIDVDALKIISNKNIHFEMHHRRFKFPQKMIQKHWKISCNYYHVQRLYILSVGLSNLPAYLMSWRNQMNNACDLLLLLL